MAEEKKKASFLKRAQAKAVYNYHRRLREQEEDEKLKQALSSGSFVDEQLSKKEEVKEESKKGK
jgi:hypothetical protein